ncbi:serologically defined colon cancer antigen 8 homolog isoform X2 [Ischnura elegans]|uniref:serologically defined colon cancer antigen 8 homolog isoform X2 n=1 Tax=Ischnura elegans TaxID=197161 RepID=UPI001ED8B176|nr:serologically defined colon cancer antigen 8 homolog isoform X2 [Ischnura elegans]
MCVENDVTAAHGRSASAWPHRMDQSGLRRRTNPDYTDVAYREAVSRLRYLLAESYAPPSIVHQPTPSRVSYNVHTFPRHQSSHGKKGDDSGDETDFSAVQSERSAGRTTSHLTRPSLYGSSRPYVAPASPYKATAARLGLGVASGDGQQQGAIPTESQQPPPELMAFIQRQEEYIDQLEKESQYCRDELSNLLGKVKEVIAENEDLHDKQKSGLMKSMFDYLDTEEEDFDDDGDDDLGDEKDMSTMKGEKKVRDESKPTPKTRRLEGPSIVFESRITELEAQLSQAKIDLDKSKVECEALKKQLAHIPSSQSSSSTSTPDMEALRAEIDTLRREKGELRENIAKLQAVMTQLRESESSASHKVKRAQDSLEQAQFEKNQAELEVHRLKDELDRQHQRLRDTIQDQARKVAEERSAVERRFIAQIEQLNNELLNAREETARVTLELERQRRSEADARRELSLRASSGDELQRELQAKIAHLQAELSSAASARGVVEQEASGAKFAAERSEREARAEASRLGAEVGALRQRLERTESELLRSREECLRLSEQISALQRELSLAKMSRSGPDKGYSEDSSAAEKREKEVTAMIQEMENKHVQTVSELEGMIQSQNQVVAKLKDECHLLTQKLEDASARHKSERANLRNDNSLLAEKLKSIWRVSESLQAQCLEHTALYNQMSQRLEEMELHERESSEQIYKLLTNQSKLLKERDHMFKELGITEKPPMMEWKKRKPSKTKPTQQPPNQSGIALLPLPHLPGPPPISSNPILSLPVVSSTNRDSISPRRARLGVTRSLGTPPEGWKGTMMDGWPPPLVGEGTFPPPAAETTTWAMLREDGSDELQEGVSVRTSEREVTDGGQSDDTIERESQLNGYPVDSAGPLTLEDLATVSDT